MKDCTTMKALEKRLHEARTKHPAWSGSLDFALSVLKLEQGELEHAMNWESEARVRDEALDVAAVALRIYEGDWK
jgi:hypothetical protein